MRPASPLPQHGVSLVEALVALVIMSIGMVALVGLQSTLRLSADVARQRSEAVRLAQAETERWRAFTTLAAAPGQVAYADLLGTDVPVQVDGQSTNTRFALSRTVVSQDAPARKSLRILVQWQDRAGNTQQVDFNSVIAGIDPALSGSLLVRPYAQPVRRPLNRHVGIPLQAKDFGDGTSAFRPPGSANLRAWVFDNATGVITRLCAVANPAVTNTTLAPENIVNCSEGPAHYLAGQVRFINSGDVNAARAEAPDGHALNLDMALTLSSANHPSPGWECFDDAPVNSGQALNWPKVSYHCAVMANPQRTWSGQLDVRPLPFEGDVGAWAVTATGENLRKVCRYTVLAGDTGANRLHPAQYVDVPLDAPLAHQNFLVIPAAATCPQDVPADPARGDYVNSNTRQHQPVPPPAPTPP